MKFLGIRSRKKKNAELRFKIAFISAAIHCFCIFRFPECYSLYIYFYQLDSRSELPWAGDYSKQTEMRDETNIAPGYLIQKPLKRLQSYVNK